MPHLLETSVGSVDAAAHNAEALALDLLAQQVILGEENLLMKSAEFAEFFQVEQHEHSSGEGMMQAREILEQIVARIEELVDPTAPLAQDVCGDTVQLLALGEFHSTAHD